MSTSLSRHLFRLDEVAASLRYCIVERRIEEGMYWTEELIESQEYKLLFETLLEVWVFAVSIGRISFIPEFVAAGKQLLSDPATAENSLRLLSFGLLKLPKSAADGSVFAIATITIEDLKSNPLENQMETMSITRQQHTEGHQLTSALLRGHIREGVRWIFRGQPMTGLLFDRRAYTGAIRYVDKWTTPRFQTPIWRRLWGILDALVLMVTDEIWAETTKPPVKSLTPSITELLQSWKAMSVRPRRRCFKVTPVAIKWLTARGRTPYTESTVGEIMDGVEQRLRGCVYWDRKAAEFGLSDPGANWEPGWDGFMNFAFPEDIPDEWSAEDRAQSHGDGFLIPGTAPSRPNWFRSWYPVVTAFPTGKFQHYSSVRPEEFKAVMQIIENSTIGPEVLHVDEWLAAAVAAAGY